MNRSPGESPRSILIIKPSSLGDVVHTLPAVARLRARFPKATLRWLVNPEWAPLLEANPDIDEIVLFPRAQFRGLAGWLKIVPWARAMRARYQADLVVDFQGLLRSALIGWLCRAPRGLFAGLSDAREGARFFYDRVAAVSEKKQHAVDRYLRLAECLGATASSEALCWPLPQGAPLPAIEPGFVLLHPFSRGTGKSLSVAEVEAFCRALAPLRVVVAGRTAEKIAPLENVSDVLNATSLGQLIWLIRQARFVVSVDSGPMHIASALTPRLLAIHTWSDPEKVGPYSEHAWIWKAGRLFQRGTSGEAAADLGAVARFVKEQAAEEARRFGGPRQSLQKGPEI